MAGISHKNHNHPATPAGRAACREAANISLADAVDALRGVRDGMSAEEFATLAQKHEDACLAHAALVNITLEAAILKVGLIVSMLPRTR